MSSEKKTGVESKSAYTLRSIFYLHNYVYLEQTQSYKSTVSLEKMKKKAIRDFSQI